MKRNISWARLALALVLGCLPAALHAQEVGTVTGTITRDIGGPLMGAQVVIADLQIGALSNATGRYTLNSVPTGTHIVRASMLGFSDAEAEIVVTAGGTVTVDLVLTEQAIALDGVVVTALGINREERAVGYAVESVSGDDLSDSKETNVVNALAGKVAGVQIKSTGPLGGSSSIVLRGYSSISGNNQPLFIIDGVPIDNSTPNKAEDGTSLFGNIDYGNAVQDLNPEDIESMSVLKGANAAALYGARAANGVILITTKNGRGVSGLGIQASTNFSVDTPARMPVYQNVYGGGATNTGYEWVDGAGGGINDGVDESWGMPLDGRIVQQWDGVGPWLPVPYSVRTFYQTGHTVSNNVSVSGAFDRGSVRFSAAQMDATGFVQNQELDRTTFSIVSNFNVTDRFNLDGGATYARNEGKNRPGVSAGSYNIPYMWLWWQRSTDMVDLKKAIEGYDPADGELAPNWNHNYFDNPYWMTDYRTNNDIRDRVTGHASASYDLNNWISVMGRAGTDWYQHRTSQAFPIYSQENPFGGFTEGSTFLQETNADVLLSLEPNLSDVFSISVRGGANARYNDRQASFLRAERINLPGIYNVSNAAIPPTINEGIFRKRVNSLYGLASFAYQNYFFVDATGRNDWSSTLPEGMNSYFYPSLSTSFVFTDAFGLSDGLLQYGKLRASWAKVGNDADPYQLAAVAELYDPSFGGVVGYTTADRLPNAQLRPEETVSWEVGGEFRIGRAILDLTYYNSLTKDQILPVDISAATGYTNLILNAGEVANRGVEGLLSAELIAKDDFSWSSSLNFGSNKSEVVSLHEELETLQLATFGGLTVEARRGYPYGALFGNMYLRNDNGDIIVNAQGRPQTMSTPQVIGSFEPDWTAGIENSFRFGDISFSFLIDHRQGGSILCGTCRLGNRTGVLVESLEGREDGGLVFPGVFEDGTPNNIALPNRTYWGSSGVYNIHEQWVYDATFTKLREMKFGFNLPSGLLRKLPMSSAQVNLVARNLAIWTDVPHIDPETSRDNTNAQGIEYSQYPTPRSIGLTLSVTH